MDATSIHRGEVGKNADSNNRRHNSQFARLRLLRTPSAQDVLSRDAKHFAARLDFNELLATILLIIVSMGVVLLTYSGVSIPLFESGGGLIDKGHALSFAVIVGVLSWLGWQFIFTIIHKLSGKRLLTGLIAGALYVLSITAIDAPFSVLALGGPTAVKLSLVDTSRYYEDAALAVFDRTTKAAQMVPALRTQKERFWKVAQVEIDTGAQSGRKGEGKVSLAFMQIATMLGTLADEIDKGLVRANTIRGQVSDAVAQMKTHVFVAGDISERSQGVSMAADKIDRLLGQLRQYDATTSIEASLAVLEQIIPAQASAKSDFEVTQNAELTVIREMAKPVAAALRAALESMASEEISVRSTRPLDAMEAIRVYWWPLLPQWVASIFLDIAPLGLLIMLLAGRREVSHLHLESRKGERA